MSIGRPRLFALAAYFQIALAGPLHGAPVAAAKDSAGHATLLKSMSVIKRKDLDFGELAVLGSGTAVIDPTAASLATTGVTRIDTSAQPKATIRRHSR